MSVQDIQMPFDVEQAIADAANLTGVDRQLLRAVAWIESRGNPQAVGDDGTSHGLFQFQGPTWNEWGGGGDPFEPKDAALAAARFLEWLLARYDGDWRAALAGYNWGIGNLERRGRYPEAGWLERAPAVTRSYIAQAERILGQAAPPTPAHVAEPSAMNLGLVGVLAVLAGAVLLSK